MILFRAVAGPTVPKFLMSIPLPIGLPLPGSLSSGRKFPVRLVVSCSQPTAFFSIYDGWFGDPSKKCLSCLSRAWTALLLVPLLVRQQPDLDTSHSGKWGASRNLNLSVLAGVKSCKSCSSCPQFPQILDRINRMDRMAQPPARYSSGRAL